MRPYHQHFDGEHNEGHTPHFYCFPSLPGVFSVSEPDGAPWVLRLPRAGVRAGHGREGSHLDLLPCKEDLSLNIKALLYLAAVSGRSPLVSFLAEIRIETLCPLFLSHCVLSCFKRAKCIPKADKIMKNNNVRLKGDTMRSISALMQKSVF